STHVCVPAQEHDRGARVVHDGIQVLRPGSRQRPVEHRRPLQEISRRNRGGVESVLHPWPFVAPLGSAEASSVIPPFHESDLLLKELLDAVLGYEDVRDGDLQTLTGEQPRETFQRREPEGVPGYRLDALDNPAHRRFEQVSIKYAFYLMFEIDASGADLG